MNGTHMPGWWYETLMGDAGRWENVLQRTPEILMHGLDSWVYCEHLHGRNHAVSRAAVLAKSRANPPQVLADV
jgi:hypothetical protein